MFVPSTGSLPDPYPTPIPSKDHSVHYSVCIYHRKRTYPAMKQKQLQKDHGKDLYHAVLILIALCVLLAYLRV
ncbi:MAG: hypothetical protein JWP27_1549 [Flaviaesturariibacter sp.]|nr:hypothetical protein [Flaviaesturariibacter sp.]